MIEGLAFLDIIFFAMVAGFLFLRLRSVLGRRTGHERRPGEPFGQRPALPGKEQPETLPENVTRLPKRDLPADAEPGIERPPAGSQPTLEAGLAQIRVADPSFDPAGFAGGARGAFEMIVGAFAAGDTASLRPLLSDEVFDNFAAAIRGRQQAKQTLETTLVAIDSAEVIEARLEGRTAFVTVKFQTQQVNVTKNTAGEVVDGDPGKVASVVDIWTFARNTRSRDPNWVLVATTAQQ